MFSTYLLFLLFLLESSATVEKTFKCLPKAGSLFRVGCFTQNEPLKTAYNVLTGFKADGDVLFFLMLQQLGNGQANMTVTYNNGDLVPPSKFLSTYSMGPATFTNEKASYIGVQITGNQVMMFDLHGSNLSVDLNAPIKVTSYSLACYYPSTSEMSQDIEIYTGPPRSF